MVPSRSILDPAPKRFGSESDMTVDVKAQIVGVSPWRLMGEVTVGMHPTVSASGLLAAVLFNDLVDCCAARS